MEPELEAKTRDASAQPARELGVPSVLYVAAAAGPSGHLVAWGPAAGWMTPQGIAGWEREVSVVARDAVTPALKEELGATLPEEQIAAAKLPLTARAAKASPLIGVTRGLVEKLVAKGVRVHTVGFDKVSSGFYYFAEGGSAEAVRVDGSLFEMIAPALGGGSNADVDRLLDGLIDRLVTQLSASTLTEAALELAAALPKLTVDNTGLADCDLDAFETQAATLEQRSDKHAPLAHSLADALAGAGAKDTVKVPLYGEARREMLPAIEVEAGGKMIALPAKARWRVSGVIVPEAAVKPVVVAPVAAPAKPVVVAPVAAAPIVAAAKPVVAAKVEPKVAAVETKPAIVAATPKKADAKPVEVAKAATVEESPKAEPRPSAAPKAPAKVGGKAAAKAAKAAAKAAAKSAAKEAATKVVAENVTEDKPVEKVEKAAKTPSIAPPSKRIQKRQEAELAAVEKVATVRTGNAGLPAPVASAGLGRIVVIAALVAIVAFLVYRTMH